MRERIRTGLFRIARISGRFVPFTEAERATRPTTPSRFLGDVPKRIGPDHFKFAEEFIIPRLPFEVSD
jgi:hypothetical protein